MMFLASPSPETVVLMIALSGLQGRELILIIPVMSQEGAATHVMILQGVEPRVRMKAANRTCLVLGGSLQVLGVVGLLAMVGEVAMEEAGKGLRFVTSAAEKDTLYENVLKQSQVLQTESLVSKSFRSPQTERNGH